MRKALGILCMLLGMALVLGALSLFLNNQQEDRQAREHTQQVLPVLRQEIQQIREETPAETDPAPADYTPAEYLSP
jgi:phage I-like protein